jgi:hypothetical protein
MSFAHLLDTPFLRRAGPSRDPPPAPPVATPPRSDADQQRREYRIRARCPPRPPRPPSDRVARLPDAVLRDPGLTDGEKLTLADVLSLAGAKRWADTLTASLATLAGRHVRTVQRRLKALQARGYLWCWRERAGGRLRVVVLDPALPPRRPLPPEVEAVWRARRLGGAHPAVRDALDAAHRRLRRALLLSTGAGGVATRLSPITGATHLEDRKRARRGSGSPG